MTGQLPYPPPPSRGDSFRDGHVGKAELRRADSESWLHYWEERVTPPASISTLVGYISGAPRHNFDTMKRVLA